MLRNYTRWRKNGGVMEADLLGIDVSVVADETAGKAWLITDGQLTELSPDEARLIGVRLIEAAALADGDRAIRRSA